MATKWSITPPIRDDILKKRTFKGVWNRTLTIMVILVVLSLVSVFAFFHLSTKNLENNIIRSLEHNAEQRQINIDFRLRSLEQLDKNLTPLIYPYTYSDGDLPQQYAEYSELNAILSTHTEYEDVSNIRLYISDSKIYSHQGITYYPLSSLPQESVLEHPGVTWLETHQINLTTFLKPMC